MQEDTYEFPVYAGKHEAVISEEAWNPAQVKRKRMCSGVKRSMIPITSTFSHGVFFFGCLILPMTGVLRSTTGGDTTGGVIALECWCVYFIPIGILSTIHFGKRAGK